MLNPYKSHSFPRITAGTTAVAFAMLTCMLSAPRTAAAQQQTTEGAYIAFETSDRGTIGADVLESQSITDGTRLLLRMTGSSYDVEFTEPSSEPRVDRRIEIFSGSALIARVEQWSDGSVMLQDPSGARHTGAGELRLTQAMYDALDPNAAVILDERFQQALFDVDYLPPDSTGQANIIKVIVAIAACCLKIKVKCTEKDGCSETEVGFDCTCF